MLADCPECVRLRIARNTSTSAAAFVAANAVYHAHRRTHGGGT